MNLTKNFTLTELVHSDTAKATRFNYCDVLKASDSMDEIMELKFDFKMLDFSK